MSEKQPPLQIHSLADALDWIECSFKWAEGPFILRPNQVKLREGIVLYADLYITPGPGLVSGWQWAILNDRKEILARGVGGKHADWNAEAMILWRACLAWGPGKDPEVEYIYFTTFVDDDGQQEDDTRNIGRAPMPHDDASRKGMPTAKDWELVSTNIAPVRGRDDVLAGPKRERARIYYHWRRAVR